jgi:carboxyl-terminal processing protease
MKKTVSKSLTIKFKTKKRRKLYMAVAGIVPDVFVPLRREHGNESIVYLLQSGIVGNLF